MDFQQGGMHALAASRGWQISYCSFSAGYWTREAEKGLDLPYGAFSKLLGRVPNCLTKVVQLRA